MTRRADEDHLVREERLELDRAAAAGGADDAELQLALGYEGYHRLRVVHGQAEVERRVPLVELAEEERHDDRRRACRRTDLERACERPEQRLPEIREHLLLQREQSLGASIETRPGVGGNDATA